MYSVWAKGGLVLMIVTLGACVDEDDGQRTGKYCSYSFSNGLAGTEQAEAVDEGNGFVSQGQSGFADENGAYYQSVVVEDCRGAASVTIRLWGDLRSDTPPDLASIKPFVVRARAQGLLNDLEALAVEARRSGFPDAQVRNGVFDGPHVLQCACEMAAKGRLPDPAD
jgi:hypothetical protein